MSEKSVGLNVTGIQYKSSLLNHACTAYSFTLFIAACFSQPIPAPESMLRRTKVVLRQKEAQHDTSIVYLIKWLVSVYL